MKIIHHDPPIVLKGVPFTVYRKWYEFWKPKSWEETEDIEYEYEYDMEGKSNEVNYEEIKRLVRGQ